MLFQFRTWNTVPRNFEQWRYDSRRHFCSRCQCSPAIPDDSMTMVIRTGSSISNNTKSMPSRRSSTKRRRTRRKPASIPNLKTGSWGVLQSRYRKFKKKVKNQESKFHFTFIIIYFKINTRICKTNPREIFF